MKLYSYWRSTSSYRLRVALALKGLAPDQVPVHLVRDGGEQHSEAYRRINPQGRVPSLVLEDGSVLIQSPAIIEYLEEVHPLPRLLPSEPVARARVRAVAAIIGCDVHPLHNVGPLNRLRRDLGRSEKEVGAWIGHWIAEGFAAVEALIGDDGYCFGDAPSLADVYLVPRSTRRNASRCPSSRSRRSGARLTWLRRIRHSTLLIRSAKTMPNKQTQPRLRCNVLH